MSYTNGNNGNGNGNGNGKKPPVRNVLGGELKSCSMKPLTGFYRNGKCDTGFQDTGVHTVCAKVTKEFLEFSVAQGNDLVTPMPAFNFSGLKPGDCWCLCAARWKEAYDAGSAPLVRLEATHEGTLRYASLAELKEHALDETE
ncbi:MAG: DUF2237 family protein [Blastocatellia bacterium]|jgi:uncharacterized protein (DUF2237 family)